MHTFRSLDTKRYKNYVNYKKNVLKFTITKFTFKIIYIACNTYVRRQTVP